MAKALLHGLIVVLVALLVIGAVMYALGARTQNVKSSVQISRPPAEVFAWVTQPDRIAQWLGGWKETRPLDSLGLSAGARSVDVMEIDGRRYELNVRIVKVEPPSLLQLKLEGEGFQSTVTYMLQDAESGGTTLTVNSASRYSGLMPRLMGAMVTSAANEKLHADLDRLRKLAEAPQVPTTQPASADGTGSLSALIAPHWSCP
ncbi:MAG: hypothetical protein BIFFINMI_01751 [Phycisphaerae bacterium]|nr:hypothetical protein [Phycisphaerae bacterium]